MTISLMTFSMYWTFRSNKTEDEITVECDGFEEACHLMFGGEDPLDYHEYEFIESSETEP